MPSLKSLKNSIASVKSTQKITSAMKMVSASKLKKAEDKVKAAEPYAIAMNGMVKDIVKTMPNLSNAPKLLKGSEKQEKNLYILISSDRGLCGGFNATLVRRFKKEFLAQHKETSAQLITIGKKAYDILGKALQAHVVAKYELAKGKEGISFETTQEIVTKILDMYDNSEFDACYLVYNQFISIMTQTPVMTKLIPIQIEKEETAMHYVAKACPEFEPSEAELLEALLPQSIMVKLYHTLLESHAGEHGARMSAMDNATRNAGDMINKLTLKYNRSRQAAITGELIEIISGAEAV